MDVVAELTTINNISFPIVWFRILIKMLFLKKNIINFDFFLLKNIFETQELIWLINQKIK